MPSPVGDINLDFHFECQEQETLIVEIGEPTLSTFMDHSDTLTTFVYNPVAFLLYQLKIRTTR